jgi:GntR family transcriptional regulator of gluconate operon
MQGHTLSVLFDSPPSERPKLERTLLRDQAIDLLRDQIVSGKIPPDTKLVEQKIADLLGISRAPVRDALRELETEGLVITRSGGRYVIRLTERDVRELYQVRRVLEKLATRLAAQNTSPKAHQALSAKLEEMRKAIAQHDRATYVKTDVEMHWLVWRQAGNEHLLRMLGSMVGPVFMFVANNADAYDWNKTLELHEEWVKYVNAGDADAAVRSIERHLDNALHRSLKVFKTSNSPTPQQAGNVSERE